MERYAWRAKVKEGCEEEYIARHNAIWAEMKAALEAAGIGNYTIFMQGNELFGYYECAKGAEYAQRIQNESPVVARWNEYMSDILVWEGAKAQPRMREVFRFDGGK